MIELMTGRRSVGRMPRTVMIGLTALVCVTLAGCPSKSTPPVDRPNHGDGVVADLPDAAGAPVQADVRATKGNDRLPGDPDAFTRRVMALVDANDQTAARTMVRGRLIEQPGDVTALFLSAQLATQSGDDDQAIQWLDALVSPPDPSQLSTEGLSDEQWRTLRTSAMGQLAELFSRRGELTRSLPLWDRILDSPAGQRGPVRTGAQIGRIDDLWRLGRRFEAAAATRAVLSRTIDRFIERGNPPDAIAAFGRSLADRALPTDPDFGGLRRRHLVALLDVMSPPTGSVDLDAKTDPAANWNQAWRALNDRRFEAALKTLESIRDEDLDASSRIALRMQMAALATDLQRVDLRNRFATVGSGLPGSGLPGSDLPGSDLPGSGLPGYWVAAADWYLDGGSGLDDVVAQRRAKWCLAEALRLEPTWQSVHERLASLLLRMGRTAAARRIDERRLALAGPREAHRAIGPGAPDDQAATLAIVTDLRRLGQPDQALAWMAMVGSRDPETFGELSKAWNTLIADRLRSRTRLIDDLDRSSQTASDTVERQIAREVRAANFSLDPIVPIDDPSAETAQASPSMRFEDVAAKSGITFVYRAGEEVKQRLFRLYEQLGGGIIAFDYDRDGRCDLYFGQGGSDDPRAGPSAYGNELYRNLGTAGGNPTNAIDAANAIDTANAIDVANATDVADDAQPPRFDRVDASAGLNDRGYARGITYADVNGDGWPDVLVGNQIENVMYLNVGDGTFKRHKGFRDEAPRATTSVAMADVNADGWCDVLEIVYTDDDAVYQTPPVTPSGRFAIIPGPNKFRSGIDRVWFGTATGEFRPQDMVDAAAESFERQGVVATDAGSQTDVPRIGDAAYPGLGVVVDDLDGDGRLDWFVANDTRPNTFWTTAASGSQNKPDGHVGLIERAGLAGLATGSQGKSMACMGIATADIDGNGTVDLVVTNWIDEWLNYFKQISPGRFSDVAPRVGLDVAGEGYLGFGIQASDFDCDGDIDLLVANGHVDDMTHRGEAYRMPTQLLTNNGRGFVQAGPVGEALATPRLGRCLITADLNGDLRPDAIIGDAAGPAAVLLNRPIRQATTGTIEIKFVSRRSHRDAIGSRVVRINQATISPAESTAKSIVAIDGSNDVVRPGNRVATEPRFAMRYGLPTGDGYLGRNEAAVRMGGLRDTDKIAVQITWPDDTTEVRRGLRVGRRYLWVQDQPIWVH